MRAVAGERAKRLLGEKKRGCQARLMMPTSGVVRVLAFATKDGKKSDMCTRMSCGRVRAQLSEQLGEAAVEARWREAQLSEEPRTSHETWLETSAAAGLGVMRWKPSPTGGREHARVGWCVSKGDSCRRFGIEVRRVEAGTREGR